MNPAAYLEMAETESTHWWFVGRRAIIASIMERLGLAKSSSILEVGCGTGGNLLMLGAFGKVSAMEMDGQARAIASVKTESQYDIRAGSCPEEIPFQGQLFDLICMFDVLEHIEPDSETLIAIKRMLAKNGRILITVPAYRWLWSAHDDYLHHRRRYTATELRRKLMAAGLRPLKMSYFNTILFPFAAVMRLKDRLLGSASAAGSRVPPAPINTVLTRVFAAERFLLGRFDLSFGVSLLCVVEAADER